MIAYLLQMPEMRLGLRNQKRERIPFQVWTVLSAFAGSRV